MADSPLKTQIQQNAVAPAKASGDGTSAEQHTLSEQIKADRYLAGQSSAERNHFGVRFAKLEAPGAG